MDRKSFLKLISITPILTGMKDLNDLYETAQSLKFSDQMPVLFLGHGNPMNAIEDNQFVRGFKNIAKTLPTPTAILCVSAHWFTKGTRVTAMEMPETIHDFSGFPEELYRVQYPAKGDPKLAMEAKSILEPTSVVPDFEWGLDHGAWSVIKHLYPEANIPVIQLSIDYTKPASYHYELAQRLSSLRKKGILIIGSGNIIHNLRLVDFRNLDKDNYGFDWAIEAHESINTHLTKGDFHPLINYEKQTRAYQLAIPTPDHYLPLIYTLGLKGQNEEMFIFNDKLLAGSLSMTSLRIG